MQKRWFIERKKEFEESDSFRHVFIGDPVTCYNPTVFTIPRAKLSVNFSDPVVYIIDSSSLARHSRSGVAMQRNYVTAINTSHNPPTTGLRRADFKIHLRYSEFNRATTPLRVYCVRDGGGGMIEKTIHVRNVYISKKKKKKKRTLSTFRFIDKSFSIPSSLFHSFISFLLVSCLWFRW